MYTLCFRCEHAFSGGETYWHFLIVFGRYASGLVLAVWGCVRTEGYGCPRESEYFILPAAS